MENRIIDDQVTIYYNHNKLQPMFIVSEKLYNPEEEKNIVQYMGFDSMGNCECEIDKNELDFQYLEKVTDKDIKNLPALLIQEFTIGG